MRMPTPALLPAPGPGLPTAPVQSSSIRSSYDEVPYENHPFAQTHPDRLATVAKLLGLNPDM